MIFRKLSYVFKLKLLQLYSITSISKLLKDDSTRIYVWPSIKKKLFLKFDSIFYEFIKFVLKIFKKRMILFLLKHFNLSKLIIVYRRFNIENWDIKNDIKSTKTYKLIKTYLYQKVFTDKKLISFDLLLNNGGGHILSFEVKDDDNNSYFVKVIDKFKISELNQELTIRNHISSLHGISFVKLFRFVIIKKFIFVIYDYISNSYEIDPYKILNRLSNKLKSPQLTDLSPKNIVLPIVTLNLLSSEGLMYLVESTFAMINSNYPTVLNELKAVSDLKLSIIRTINEIKPKEILKLLSIQHNELHKNNLVTDNNIEYIIDLGKVGYALEGFDLVTLAVDTKIAPKNFKSMIFHENLLHMLLIKLLYCNYRLKRKQVLTHEMLFDFMMPLC